MAEFKGALKTPDKRDPLIIFVRAGKSSSKHSFTIVVGTGSSEQDLVGAPTINFLTDASSGLEIAACQWPKAGHI